MFFGKRKLTNRLSKLEEKLDDVLDALEVKEENEKEEEKKEAAEMSRLRGENARLLKEIDKKNDMIEQILREMITGTLANGKSSAKEPSSLERYLARKNENTMSTKELNKTKGKLP